MNNQPQPIFWAVGGGKGGVGKTFISINLGVSLTKMGLPVTLVDLDLGGANVHTHLGANSSQFGLSDLLRGRVSDINKLVTPTDFPHLFMVSGFNDALNVANITDNEKNMLVEQIKLLRTPFVILDLGAGTSEHTLDFFLAADRQIIAVTPEPTSIENAYRFIKASFYRHLRTVETDATVQNIIREAMDNRNQYSIRSPADLVLYIGRESESMGLKLMQAISEFEIMLILNQVRSRADVELGHSIKSVCRKYFGIEVSFCGYINYDNAVWQSLRKKKPLFAEHPYSEVVGQFLAISRYLANPQMIKAVV